MGLLLGTSKILKHDQVASGSGENLSIYLWGGLLVQADISYHGSNESVDVHYQFHVDGGLLRLIHRNATGIVMVLNGESRWVSSGVLFGFGKINIRAVANEHEKKATGRIFGCYVVVDN